MEAISGSGTGESTWAAWSAPATWPRLDLRLCRRAVVVAPHPDDEILGVGGVIALLADQNVEVTVVAVTDGEASHPMNSAVDTQALAWCRTLESVAAITDLGLDPATRLRLRVADGHVGSLLEAVTDALSLLLRPGDWCFATWRGDGHPDHEAVGHAAAVACERIGARLLEFPIWMWHWATPDDVRVPWHQTCVVDLHPEVATRKRRALSRFISQIEPLGPGTHEAAILPPHVLERFHRSWEVVLVTG